MGKVEAVSAGSFDCRRCQKNIGNGWAINKTLF